MTPNAMERCPELFQLLGAYLHQDFDLDDDTASAALTRGVAATSPTQLRAAAGELREHRPSRDDEAATREFVNALCSYHPPGDGSTYVSWLDHVQDVLDGAELT